MKVMHIVESMAGGVITSCSQICNILQSNGHEVVLVYSPLRDEFPANWESYFHPGIKKIRVDMARNIDFRMDVAATFNIYRIMRSMSPDVVHLHSSKAGFMGRLIGLFYRRAAFLYSPRGFAFLQDDFSRVARGVFRFLEWIAGKSDCITVACSQGEYDAAIGIGSSPQKVCLIENAIDEAKLPNSARRVNNQIRIGTLGRISAQKDPGRFCEVIKRLGNSSKLEFIWVGDGKPSEDSELRENNVNVTGWLNRNEALEIMATFDIYLQTSRWEGMPLALIEAALLKVPVVTTDILGNRDVVNHKVTGFVAGDSDGLVSALEELIESENLRNKMGEAARSLAIDRFGVARLEKEIISLYSARQPLAA